jgi:protein-S-isoprenylcysteine O-methyltransferase Ste14
MLRLFLLIYLILFFSGAMIWPSYRTWRTTDVNPYRLHNQTGVAGFVGAAFRLTLLAIIAIVLIYVLAAGVYAYLIPIQWLISPILRTIGLALLVISAVWVIAAQIHMGKSWRIGIDDEHATPLVTRGVFRFSRNPIFLGMRLMLAGLFFTLPNAATLAIWLLGDALIRIQVYLEEEHLLKMHGRAYEDYQRQVRRWL